MFEAHATIKQCFRYNLTAILGERKMNGNQYYKLLVLKF